MIKTCTETAALPATILVIEDEVVLRFVASEMLREAGYEVVVAASADEAMLYLATGAHISLVFSDVEMPGSMDGFALAHRLAAERPDIGLILTSGREWPAATLGTIPFLRKPYDLPQLTEQVVSLLRPKNERSDDQDRTES